MTTIRFLTVLLSLIFVLTTTCLSETTLSTGEDVTTFVKSKIEEHSVMVFAKSYCRYCLSTKGLFKALTVRIKDLEVEYLDIDKLPNDDGSKIQKELKEMTGQSTVPNIFIGQEHIGGSSDVSQLLESKKLEPMLLKYFGNKSEL